jgi:hypothetical protein
VGGEALHVFLTEFSKHSITVLVYNTSIQSMTEFDNEEHSPNLLPFCRRCSGGYGVEGVVGFSGEVL